MHLIEVIPFAKNLRRESLSYFSSKDIKLGSIVTIDLRKSTTLGLVVSSKNVSNEKAQLKNSSFALRKIKGVTKNFIYQTPFLRAAEETASYHASSTGSVLQLVTSSHILDQIKEVSKPKKEISVSNIQKPERFILQDNREERYSHYKNLVRGQFAQKKSVILICPTQEDVLQTEQNLKKGIEIHTHVLYSSLTKKQTIKKWNDIIESQKPVLIITTPIFLGIPRHDIGTIIIDKESSRSYKTQKAPYLDIRFLAENYASFLDAKFVVGDIILRSEVLWRYDENHFEELAPIKFRSLSSAKASLVKMNIGEDDPFSIFSDQAIELLRENRDQNEQIFLFVARKGLSPSILCGDCGTVVVCDHCSSPVVLYGKDATKKENYFKCHLCGDERHAGEACKNCKSWKLKTFGIGTQKVETELKSLDKELNVFVLDSETAKTPKQAKLIIEEFYNTPGGILVGTEMALLYMHTPIENSIIVSTDALLSLPDFAIRERIMRTLLQIRSTVTQNFLIQTRKSEDTLFDLAVRGNLSDFFREEFIKRKQFMYPPFSNLIKISLIGTRASVEKEFEKLRELLKPADLLIYPAFTEVQKGKYVMNGLIKLKRGKWIDEELKKKLMSLPPQFKVVIDTESLL